MFRFSESSSETNHFIFFHDYEEESFEIFVDYVLKTLNVREESYKKGPYATLVSVFFEGYKIILTSGSFEGCYISMEKKDSFLSKKIIDSFSF